MAGTSNDFQDGAPFYLDPTQQDLLLAALASNNQNPLDMFSTGMDNNTKRSMSNAQYQYPIDALDPTFFTTPQQTTPANALNAGIEESPFIDYLDGDTTFDFDNADNSELMIGDLPGETPGNYDDSNEKRKSPDDDDDDDDEGGGKRREGDDKQAKKPGRKPLTSEPTTNRAAQRAFRERKEKHLKDLETKVQELEQASDASNHENGLLRAQVQRLQTELREYRKRLSLNSTGVVRPQAPASGFSTMLNNGNGNFQFDFPHFGAPNSQLPNNATLARINPSAVSAGATARHNSLEQSVSPTRQSNGFSTQAFLPTKAAPASAGAQRSGSLNSSSSSNHTTPKRSSTDSSNTTQSRVFQFNSSSSTHSGSPSVSSTSPAGPDSSCGTSPEPSHTSPGQLKDTIADGYVCHGNSEGEVLFCEKLNMACGNPRNPVPRAMSRSDDKPSPAAVPKALSPAPTAAAAVNGIDYFANQNGGHFDPTLFGEYRDTQNAIVGDGDFTGGFFNDAFLNTGYGSPFHFGDTPAVQKPNPMELIERIQDGDEEVVPGEDINSMLNCHKIWDKLSSRPDFKDGTIDIDNLCSELRAKARCSESGVVVDHKDVEAALKRLPADRLPPSLQ
ncbi:PAP1-domain-containing protein [Dothidotthia symphoricarpi CBS 119687]|uniref:PAP1-domain-containing protein n=1 Tax=Dothidotthia symphoricarpi CBS 119687 TaxID=1392245 RepID=A0A6A6AID1_9PLEO|nr:PAP1-domain-containing protein [Dothidotthia symphoricarpi CBS 119687]KAF2130667.1 PAP1-domain-containing protein [Dothidotthia symphoricarpi CBS 119687]